MTGYATTITLTEKQEKTLKTLSNSRTAPLHLQQRSMIILLCAQGKSNKEIMEETSIHRTTVSKWRTRWAANKEKFREIDTNEHGIAYQRLIEKVLSDAPRSGKPCKFTAEQICQIINVSCESPIENELPFSHWSLSSLAYELKKRNIVDSISTSHLQVFLKSSKYKTT